MPMMARTLLMGEGSAPHMIDESMMLFTGNANRPLARAIARHLHMPLGKATVGLLWHMN